MLREEILSSSRELVNQIYGKMSVIESCDTVAEKVKNLDVCFNDLDNNQIVVLHEILNAEQLAGIRDGIISKIYENAKEAQNFLERLNRGTEIPQIPPFAQGGIIPVESKCDYIIPDQEVVIPIPEKRKAAIINPEFEAAVQDMVESCKKPKDKPEPKVMTVEEVSRMYIDECKPMTEIANYYGVTKSVVNNFIYNNHLARKKAPKVNKPTYPEMTVEAVRDMYTNGTASLVDVARYFGATKEKLHNFVKANKLERVVAKPNDPFLDSNKMGKEKFREKMLKSQK